MKIICEYSLVELNVEQNEKGIITNNLIFGPTLGISF